MDAALERFLPVVEKEMKSSLDYSIVLLKVLELWIKQNYNSVEEMKAKTAHLDGCARYVGEVIRKQLGGKWDIDLERPDNVFYGLPIMVGDVYGSDCPLSLVTASMSRSNDDFIFTIVGKMKNRMQKN